MKSEANLKLDIAPKTELMVNNTEVRCRVLRIDDKTFYRHSEEKIAIAPDYAFLMDLNHTGFDEKRRLSIARFYSVFRLAFGESGRSYDDWKGSFCFHFKLDVLKDDEAIPYLLKVFDHRGCVEFQYYKVIQPGDSRFEVGVIHPALEDEFSTKQMNRLSAYLFGFAEGYCKGASLLDIDDFVKRVGSNHILYGYLHDDFFVMYIEDEDEFDQKYHEIEAEITEKADSCA